MEESSSTKRTYDVFLSYRLKDARKSSFTSHLLASFQDAGINVFNNDSLPKMPNHLPTSTMQTIEESKISIIFFSRNYAASCFRCLPELEKILECHRSIGQVVMPVFYDVNPDDVAHQTGEFGEIFQRIVNRISAMKGRLVKKLDILKAALVEAASMEGVEVQKYTNESEAIKDIVNHVTKLLESNLLPVVSKDTIQIPISAHGVEREVVRQKSMDIAEARTYDVCFSGADGDAKCILQLYTSLQNVGIHVLRHDAEIHGDQISVLVLQAFTQCRICVVVLSENYANSVRCMLEFEFIMERRRTRGLVVLPVFFEVHPIEVCNLTGNFGEAINDLISRTSQQYKKGVWKTAFGEVSGIPRIVVINSRSDFENHKNIVDEVTDLLVKTDLFWSATRDVIQLLNTQNSEDTTIIGIWGMAGIGKTTISRAIFNEIQCNFEANSFLQNVRGVWKQDDGKISLQQQVLDDICKTTEIEIDTVESGKQILQTRLCQKRILLVLDDVNELNQLNALCGNREWFGQGSRILVSTRNIKILNELEVDHVYKMELMDDIESLKLLCWNAFKQPIPREGFYDLCKDVVKYCDGLPLALAVVGSFMQDKSETEWKSALEKFKIIPHDILMENLRLSYDDLSDNEKEIFLDISSLFIGMGQDDVIQILEYSGQFAGMGICVLKEQSLVTVDCNKRIRMHNLVRGVGREIIRQKTMGMTEARTHDVFLSFRGVDTRAKFISHFYTSLQNAGIQVFKDDNEIQRGDKISVSLLQAISQSKIAIVVLSRHYPNSKWCMLELEKIIEIRRSSRLVVVPVFYEVSPSEVRSQTGEFGEAFKDLMSRISIDEYTERNWRRMLFEVGGIAGNVIINSRDESEDIKKSVDQVYHLLDKPEFIVAEHPVGVKSRTQDVVQLLNSHKSKDPVLLGIWGMGGVGKTTIAKAVYNKIHHDFEAKCFLLNVREAWNQDKDKISLQQQLLSDIYKTTKEKINTVELGKTILQKKLRQKKIFLVLDDVSSFEQLNALCERREWFGEESRIIITTRDVSLLRKLKVDHEYKMRVMDDNESCELFNWHAFNHPSPSEGFADLSRDVIKYSGGLPLALEVIGSLLFTLGTPTEWVSVVEKLKLIPNNKVLEKLIISFDSLSDDDLKEIFLDIAFFFIGMDREDVTKVLKDCGHFPEIGISVLIQRSLITVDQKNKIRMHDLLRDMGREIVRKKSHEGGKDPSRLWHLKDVHRILSENTRTMDVKGLSLKLSRMDQTTNLKTKEFHKMNKLRLLQLAGVHLDGDYKYLSRDLRWLCWYGFNSKCAPADFHQGCLVAIDFKYSNMERVWKRSQLLDKLKILNLSHSHNLRQTPDFSMLPNLEKLILKDCPNLSWVLPSIGLLNKILLINFKDCTGLCELPRSIYKLESLQTLILSGCTKIYKLEEDIEQMKSLTTLVADKTAITEVPFAVVRLKNIGYISLCGYEGISRHVFPSIILSWMSPTNSVLSLVQEFASLDFLDGQTDSFYGLSYALKDFQGIQHFWVNCDSKAQLNRIIASILGNSGSKSCDELEAMPRTLPNDSPSQAVILSSKASLTSLLIQMGMNCHATGMLREDILQVLQDRPISGSTLLPGNKYPDWLTYVGNGYSVTLDVPKVDGRYLKTIMCIVNSSSPDILEGLKVVWLINCTKNSIRLYKRDALLTSLLSDEKEWQRLVSNTEPGDKLTVIVAFKKGFIVKTTRIYLIYDEPDKNDTIPIADENTNLKMKKQATLIEFEESTEEESYVVETPLKRSRTKKDPETSKRNKMVHGVQINHTCTQSIEYDDRPFSLFNTYLNVQQAYPVNPIEERDLVMTPLKRKSLSEKDQENSKRNKIVHDIQINHTFTQSTEYDVRPFSLIFTDLNVQQEYPTNLIEENLATSMEQDQVIEETPILNIITLETIEPRIIEEDEEALRARAKEQGIDNSSFLYGDSSSSEEEKVSTHATSSFQKSAEDKISSKERPEVSTNVESHMTLNALSIPPKMMVNKDFNADAFSSSYDKDPVATIEDIISRFTTSKESAAQRSLGSEVLKTPEVTAESLVLELREFAFERDLSENSSMSLALHDDVVKLKPKINAHEKLFTSNQLVGIKKVINIIEDISKTNHQLEGKRKSKLTADQEFEAYLQKIKTTKLEIAEQMEQIDSLATQEDEIERELVKLKSRVMELKDERKLLDEYKQLAKRKVENQVSFLMSWKSRGDAAETQMKSLEQKLTEMKDVYAKFKQNPPF